MKPFYFVIRIFCACLFLFCHFVSAAEQPRHPAELFVILDAMDANIAKIQSYTGKGVLYIESDRFSEYPDELTGEIYHDQTNTFSIAKDGDCLYVEESLNHHFASDFSTEKKYTSYQIPYGEEPIECTNQEELELKIKDLKRRKGTLIYTQRLLQTSEKKYSYTVEMKNFHINKRSQRPVMNGWVLSCFNGEVLETDTLRKTFDVLEKVTLASPERRSFTSGVTKLDNGQYQIDFFIKARIGEKAYNNVLTYLIDSKKSYTLQKYTGKVNGEESIQGIYHYVERNGIWVLSRLEMTDRKENGSEEFTRITMDESSITVNETIDPKMFSEEVLGVKKGAHFVNMLTGENRTVE